MHTAQLEGEKNQGGYVSKLEMLIPHKAKGICQSNQNSQHCSDALDQDDSSK